MSSTFLRKIQFGQETTPGTPVVATTVWRGMGAMEDMRETIWPEEAVGILGPSDRSYHPGVGAQVELDSIEATFEQLCHLFEMGIKDVGTGAADGGGSGKIYTYPLSTTSSNAIQFYTIEAGNDQRKKEMSYSFAETITLEGRYGEALKCGATIIGREAVGGVFETDNDIAFVNATSKITDVDAQLAKFLTGTTIKVSGSTDNDGVYAVATGGVAAEIVTTESLVDESAGATVTIEDWFSGGQAGLTLPSVEEILFSTAKVYIDAEGGTVGTTQVSNLVREMTITISTGIKAMKTASGVLYFSHIDRAPTELSLEITMLYNADAVAEERNWEDATSRLIQIKCEGSALATAGTTYTYKTFIANLAGSWEKFDRLESDDGVDTVKGTFKVGYNSTAGLYAEFIVVNELAAVP